MVSKTYDVVVIGAGAAGLMCAATAAKRGRSVLVLEHAKKPGRKILISGGGRCNFTNYEVTPNQFLCSNPHFVKSALSQYTNWDFISLVSQYNIDFEEREHGQLFCVDSAKEIVSMLLSECEGESIDFLYQQDVHHIEKHGQDFSLKSKDLYITAESLVIATGGLSMPKLGATPFAYKVAEQFGLNVLPTSAGLVPYTLHKEDKETLSALSGIAIPSMITTENNVTFKEALLFTHRGLSGPAVLQTSSFWKAGEKIKINLVPNDDIEALLNDSLEKHPNQTLKSTLAQVLPKRLVEVLIDTDVLMNKTLKQFNPKELYNIVYQLENWVIKPNGTEGYRTAEVTLGGIDTNHLSSKTMETKKVKGLYFVGECMDVSGWLGGYNFQWSWSSGYVAGINA